jgi:hypothetical protein
MKQPINILTGLDYWLDNLMCQVPEVLMCYHLVRKKMIFVFFSNEIRSVSFRTELFKNMSLSKQKIFQSLAKMESFLQVR